MCGQLERARSSRYDIIDSDFQKAQSDPLPTFRSNIGNVRAACAALGVKAKPAPRVALRASPDSSARPRLSASMLFAA